jgi:hypothetical protein
LRRSRIVCQLFWTIYSRQTLSIALARGSQGTSIIGLFGAAAAWTGANEKTLNRIGDKDYEKIYLYPNSHAGVLSGR